MKIRTDVKGYFPPSVATFFFIVSLFVLILNLGIIFERGMGLFVYISLGVFLGIFYTNYAMPTLSKTFSEFYFGGEKGFLNRVLYIIYIFLCATPYFIGLIIQVLINKNLLPKTLEIPMYVSLFNFVGTMMFLYAIQIKKETKDYKKKKVLSIKA